MSECFDKELSDVDFTTLETLANEKLNLYSVTEEQQKEVEQQTRMQSNSRIWFRMRTGRVTASKFKSACHNNPEKPSSNLIMSICHPELAKFSTEATKWGCSHEKTVRMHCITFQKSRHKLRTLSCRSLGSSSTDHMVSLVQHLMAWLIVVVVVKEFVKSR